MAKQANNVKVSEKRRFWETHLKAWKKSGLTQAEYCRQYDLLVHRFIYWKKRFARSVSPVTFVPINACRAIQTSNSSIDSIRLVINNRFEIAVGDDFSPATLERLIQTLERM